MEGVPRCGGAEQLFDGSCGKRPVARESQRRGIDARSQSRPPEQWVLRSADFLGQDDVGGSIPGEIIRINAEPAVRRRRVRRVQPQIARHQIGMPVVIEVPRRETVPPPPRGWQAQRGGYIAQLLPIELLVKLERHPFSRRDKIQPPIVVKIDPDSGGDQAAWSGQLPGYLLRTVPG